MGMNVSIEGSNPSFSVTRTTRPSPGRSRCKTERAGFEPATHLSARTRFPVALLRPLGHLSRRSSVSAFLRSQRELPPRDEADPPRPLTRRLERVEEAGVAEPRVRHVRAGCLDVLAVARP